MLKRIKNLLLENQIDCFGVLPLGDCIIKRQYLLDRVGIRGGSVVIFAIPYYTPDCDKPRNLSAYAVGRDYHFFVRLLADKTLSVLQHEFPEYKFALFADHSPIDERAVAAEAGLGIIGKNGLLITEKYSSFVFLGEIVTDAVLNISKQEICYCEGCGACQKACPYFRGEIEECLSALTQQKGELDTTCQKAIWRYGSVWGCDICQNVCPHTHKAKTNGSLYSPISFFRENTIGWLTCSQLNSMDEKTFSERAYSWRGRNVILRNLTIWENKNESEKRNPTP